MAVDPKDREAFEEGQRVADMDFVESFMYKVGDSMPGPSRSESEEAAFQKGLSGEQLDGDKNDKDDD